MWCYKTVQVKERNNLKFSRETLFLLTRTMIELLTVFIVITFQKHFILFIKLSFVSSNNTVNLPYLADLGIPRY
jgi:hypothetical protein